MRAQQLFNDEWIWKFKTWRLHKECGVRPRVIHIMGLTKRREGLYRSSAGCRPPACWSSRDTSCTVVMPYAASRGKRHNTHTLQSKTCWKLKSQSPILEIYQSIFTCDPIILYANYDYYQTDRLIRHLLNKMCVEDCITTRYVNMIGSFGFTGWCSHLRIAEMSQPDMSAVCSESYSCACSGGTWKHH